MTALGEASSALEAQIRALRLENDRLKRIVAEVERLAEEDRFYGPRAFGPTYAPVHVERIPQSVKDLL